ncbi:MAG: hypothetical protein JXA54_01465, partial [Candidatus Heimdallarchaeota archaeon]|nr:hypothetical protein [Candidatus Heimdallarchaeota archaeon]
NDTTIEIEIREGIKWQSDPDEIYTNEYLDIKDVYFTFHSWRHISKNSWYWIKDMEIVDQYTMRIYVDGDPSTPENDVYAPSLPALATRILPEHFLNQTQLGDGVTPDPLHPSWNTFSKAAFGTGLFEINNFNQGVETKLRINNESWWLNEDITIDPYLNWKNRFGNFNNGLEQLRVRIIPNHFEAITIFQNGGIDIISLRNYPEIRKELLRDEKFTIQSKLLPYMGFFGFNMREIRDIIGSREPCPNDPEITIGLAVRKAISYAINKIEMNNIIHEGDFFITDWPIYPSMGIWCNPNIIRYNFDLELAKKYMAKAGFIIETPITNQYNSIASFFREWWPVLLGITIGVPVVVFSSVGLVKFSKYLNKRILLKKQKHNDKLEN